MKTPGHQTTDAAEPADESSTGLPWPRTWRGVYLLVVVIFATWVALLTAFMKAFA